MWFPVSSKIWVAFDGNTTVHLHLIFKRDYDFGKPILKIKPYIRKTSNKIYLIIIFINLIFWSSFFLLTWQSNILAFLTSRQLLPSLLKSDFQRHWSSFSLLRLSHRYHCPDNLKLNKNIRNLFIERNESVQIALYIPPVTLYIHFQLL